MLSALQPKRDELPDGDSMYKQNRETINVQGISIDVIKHNGDEYVSLTDMASVKNAEDARHVIFNWLSTY